MHILVIGSGLMGPAAAFNAMSDPTVKTVTLADMDPTQLETARARLAALPGGEKVRTVTLDLRNQEQAIAVMAAADAVVAAIPSVTIPLGVAAAAEAGTPWVDLSWPPPDQLESLRHLVAEKGALVIPGCGVEPGLTEIMARHLAEKLDTVEELHIKCGGIPAVPSGPLHYKIVFGGKRLPLREANARIAQDGALVEVPRYSGVETFDVEGIGEVEAWHEGFMPWLLELDALRDLKLGTQKTVRWPGYAAKVTALRELGLLSMSPWRWTGCRWRPRRSWTRSSTPTCAWARTIATSRSSVSRPRARRTAAPAPIASIWSTTMTSSLASPPWPG